MNVVNVFMAQDRSGSVDVNIAEETSTKRTTGTSTGTSIDHG